MKGGIVQTDEREVEGEVDDNVLNVNRRKLYKCAFFSPLLLHRIILSNIRSSKRIATAEEATIMTSRG